MGSWGIAHISLLNIGRGICLVSYPSIIILPLSISTSLNKALKILDFPEKKSEKKKKKN